MKIINLKFDTEITALASYSYGQQVFNEQVKDLDYNEKYKIVFPERIELISTSFVQGFFYEFQTVFGLEGILNNVEVISSIPNIKNYCLDCMY